MEAKKTTPQKILWMDLEMTGLVPTTDRIVEVAAIVTDWNFNELAVFESGVGHDSALIKKLFASNPWWSQQNPKGAHDLAELCASSPAEHKVAAEVRLFIDAHFTPHQPALLAGNSIHTDRGFIKKWWPQVEERLHYRMLDVSAWKVVMQGKFGVECTKKEAHRALDDIRESIDELKFYLQKAKM